MVETGRRSLEIPIAKTLVALRRVRSLRDPMTNSISKFGSLIDDLGWEAKSCNGGSICGNAGGDGIHESQLRVSASDIQSDGFIYHGEIERIIRGTDEQDENGSCENVTNQQAQMDDYKGGERVRVSQCRNGESKLYDVKTSPGIIRERKTGDRVCKAKHNDRNEPMNSVEAFSSNRVSSFACAREDELYGSSKFSPYSQEETTYRRRGSKYSRSSPHSPSSECNSHWYNKRELMRMEGWSHSMVLSGNEEIMGPSHNDCGIGCCWSKTPKSRERRLPHLCGCSPPSDEVHCSRKKWLKAFPRGEMALSKESTRGSGNTNLLFPSDVEALPLLTSTCSRKSVSEAVEESRSGPISVSPKDRMELAAEFRDLSLYSNANRTLSQKYRPKTFNELVGQNIVVQSLVNAISKGKVAPVYLFQGPRGTGKTSTSRIFATALNCLSLEEHRPCGFCRECTTFASGRCEDVKEMDAAKFNNINKLKGLLKHVCSSPVLTQFKVYIFDECHFLKGESWAVLLNCVKELPRHVVFILITSEPDKLPRTALSRCQRYLFLKIKDADIVSRLYRLCMAENLDFDKAALDHIAMRSNGSLRDAETILDQLSLLGQRITIPLIHELIGVVSEVELLDLLDLALSSDTSMTVRRARELMRSRIDPMALVSQLANLIMDILAGKCQLGSMKNNNALTEVELQKLRHALKILSETDKQLRSSRDQITWLTVALLQFGSSESSLVLDSSGPNAYQNFSNLRENGPCSTSYANGKLEHPKDDIRDDNASCCLDAHSDTSGKLDLIWRRAISQCQSCTLKEFLQKEGKLLSIHVKNGTKNGLAVAELQFCHPDHVSRAEKSWKSIANSLQNVLGCNVEIRINMVYSPAPTNNVKLQTQPHVLLSQLAGGQAKILSPLVGEKNQSHGDVISPEQVERKNSVRSPSCGSGCKFFNCIRQSDDERSHYVVHFHPEKSEAMGAIARNNKSIHSFECQRTIEDDFLNGNNFEIDCLKDSENNQSHGVPKLEKQPSCFSKTKLHRNFCSSNATHTTRVRIPAHKKSGLSMPKEASFRTYVCTDEPFIHNPNSNTQMTVRNGSEDDDLPCRSSKIDLKLHCWKAPKFLFKKAWHQRRRRRLRRSHLLHWVLPCATSK
ncbi:hypothetical protein AMTRI_Chr06g199620 [Amborella trichopoda]